MPLKHFTETVLVFLLGLLTILVGVVVASLPVLPRGVVPWTIVFGVALLYPLAVYPILKRDRADYAFRLLHFGPVAIAFAWFLMQVASLRFPRILVLSGLWTFAWSLVPVLMLFFLMELFCLHVIRRRSSRSLLLLLLIIPFVAIALGAQRMTNAHAIVASVLWRGKWWDLTTGERAQNVPVNGTQVALERKGMNLSHSSQPREEEWRAKLRALQARLDGEFASPKSASGGSALSQSGIMIAAAVPPAKIPPSSRLPKAGMDPTPIALAMLAAYTTVVHYRIKRRACSV